MDRLPHEASDNSRKNKGSPLLQDEGFEYDDELYAIGEAVGGSITPIQDIIEDSESATGGASGCVDEAISEAQADTDNIVRTLFTAWLQFPPSNAPGEPEFLNSMARHAMSIEWQKIKAEREVLPDHEVIVKNLAESMINYIVPSLNLLESKDIFERLSMAYVTKEVTEGWKRILKEEAAKEKAKKKRERQRRIRKRLGKQEEIAEGAPLPHDEDFDYDDELYAIGGAVGGSITPTQDILEDSQSATGGASGCVDEAISVAQEDIDNIVRTLFTAWLQFPPSSAPGKPEFLNSKARHAMSIEWQKIKAEREVLPDHEVIIKGLAESMFNYIAPSLNILEGKDIFERLSVAYVTKEVTEGWKRILEEEAAKEKAKKKRERQRIHKQLGKQEEIAEGTQLLQDEALEYATGGVVDVVARYILPTQDIIEDSESATGGASGCVDEAISVAQEDIDNIVRTLFTAWLQFPPSSAPGKPEFLNSKARHAMSIEWQKIKAEREVLPDHEVIIKGLAESMFNYIAPSLNILEGKDIFERISMAYVTIKVAEGWKRILEEEAAKERAKKKRERRQRMCERRRRQQQMAEVYRFYASLARIDCSVPLTCRTFCLFLCQCCSIFMFQVPIHTLLLSWPISMGVMGGLYMNQCPMSQLMPYVMMALGAVGTIALLMRLSFVIHEKFSGNEICSMWPWIVLKVIEFTFLDFLIIQLFYFYSESPRFVPGSFKYCNETFYSFVHYINYASIALVSAWLFVYFTKGLLWWRSRKITHRYR